MQIGCHGSVWTGSFDHDGMTTAIAGTAKAGFDLIEIPLMDADAIDVEHTRSLLLEHGLGVTASLGLTPELDISSEDTDIVAAGEKHLDRVIEVLAELGGTHLVGVLYSAMRKYMDPATPLGLEHSQDVIARLAGRGQDLGITVAIEVVNRYETNVLNTGRQALVFLDESARRNGATALVHLDTYHMNIEEPDMASPVLDAGDRLAYVHIGESNRGYVGSGTVDFDTFFKALNRIGYDGPIVFESFSSAIVHPELSRMLGVWRNLWDDPEDLADHAFQSIRNHVRSARSVAAH